MPNIHKSRLVFIKLTKKYPNPKGLYVCVCGEEKEYFIANVKRGHTNSCGCLKKDVLPKNTKHRLKRHPLYSIWSSIKRRCNVQHSQDYYLYGGRGIRMCQEWEQDFLSFYNWCINNGWKKGLKIDKDIKGGNVYSPINCSIVTNKENCNHVRTNHIIEHNGHKMNLKQWSEFLKIPIGRFRARLEKSNWDMAKYYENSSRWKK